METDNELKGIGNSLDFGARMYDSRIGKFLALDPLAKQFPSESNYIFAGNSPVIFIDKDGEKKHIFHVVIDERSGTITVPDGNKASVIVDGLKSRYTQLYGARDAWNWYDYGVIQTTVIDKAGKKKVHPSKEFIMDESNIRATTKIFPNVFSAYSQAGEDFENPFGGPVKEGKPGKTYGGYRLISSGSAHYIGRDNKYNRTGSDAARDVYVDDLLGILTLSATASGANAPTDVISAIKYVSDAVQSVNSANDAAQFGGDGDDSKAGYCKTCKDNYKIGSDGKLGPQKSTNKAVDTFESHSASPQTQSTESKP